MIAISQLLWELNLAFFTLFYMIYAFFASIDSELIVLSERLEYILITNEAKQSTASYTIARYIARENSATHQFPCESYSGVQFAKFIERRIVITW